MTRHTFFPGTEEESSEPYPSRLVIDGDLLRSWLDPVKKGQNKGKKNKKKRYLIKSLES